MQKEISELYNLIKIQNFDKAYSEAKRLHILNKDNTEIIKILAFLHIQKAQFNAAINILETHYDKNPHKKDFDYYSNMGVALKSIEEFQKSLDMYHKAREIDPDSPLCYTVH